MSCTNCSSGPVSNFAAQYFNANSPANCSDPECGSNTFNGKCIYYAGPNLSCSGITTYDNLELSLQKIDTKLCAVAGDYSTYNFNCLDDSSPITTEKQFVEAISPYVCTTRSLLTTFTSTTYPAYQSTVNARFTALEVPAVVCVSAGIGMSDTLQQALGKICTKFAALDGAMSLAGVNWGACFSVPNPPTTLSAAFNLLEDQLCQIKNVNGDVLPTFNNVGSCLDTPGTIDSLFATVNKIKTKLCILPAFDINALTWNCITQPSTTTADLQSAFQALMHQVEVLTQNFPTFNTTDFHTSASGSNACAGKTISLSTPINQDRLVASNAADSTPSTLINKLVGVGITVDDTTTPGKITFTAAGGTGDHKVKASSPDSAADFLDAKIQGMAGLHGLSIGSSYDGGVQKLKLTPVIDTSTFFSDMLDIIAADPVLLAKFCAVVNSCPSPCAPPTNVQAVALAGTSTTSTTSSTTTTTTTV